MKTKLQAVRAARGWSQAQLMDAMTDAADRLGIELPAPTSLKTQVSMFENGRRVPGQDYQTIFCEVYHSSRTDLGLAVESAPPNSNRFPNCLRPRRRLPRPAPWCSTT